MTYDVLIIGGGLAGLSAAVELSSLGASILLLEQRPHLGGRTYSFRDRKTGDPVDNGQHLLMGCYRETRSYLETIGATHLAELQPNLHIDFIHAQKGTASLRCLPLPPPLNVLSGLLRLRTLSFTNRLRLLRIGAELLASSRLKEEELASMTVDAWLKKCGQPEENRKYLWDVIAVGSLNDETDKVSALLFYRVLKTAFLGKRMNASLLIPTVGLSDLLIHPAERFLAQRGAVIRTGMGVDRIEGGSDGVGSVVIGGKREKAKVCISAVPYFILKDILPAEWTRLPSLSRLGEFSSSPIITLHLWFDRKVMGGKFAAVLDSPIQWVFNKSELFGLRKTDQYLAIVISGASKLIDLPKERLVRVALNELSTLLPHARTAKLIHSLVIKEKRATFSASPGVLPLRPDVQSGIPNFFLAGDWTNTGFPATIEGAVLSGKKAAEATLNFLRGGVSALP